MRILLIGLSMVAVAACASNLPLKSSSRNLTVTSNPEPTRPILRHKKTASTVSFSFSAFGDAGLAHSHVPKPIYRGGFKRAYNDFDPRRQLISDINYINWETSVGNTCDAFWAPLSRSTYAFLTPPQDLSDALSIGFNLIGLANNHSFDCLRSAEGNGPLQTVSHINRLRNVSSSSQRLVLFSGVFDNIPASPEVGIYKTQDATMPVYFLSAYVGGNAQHCKNMLCESGLAQYKKQMAAATGFRVLALHSWNEASHAKLKAILTSWLREGLVDVAIGTGPHVAEKVSVVKTSRGNRILATSLGNFIHPSLSRQPNNIAMVSRWIFDTTSGDVKLESLESIRLSCHGESCKREESKNLL